MPTSPAPRVLQATEKALAGSRSLLGALQAEWSRPRWWLERAKNLGAPVTGWESPSATILTGLTLHTLALPGDLINFSYGSAEEARLH